VLDALLFKQTNQYQQIGTGSRDHTYHSMSGLPINASESVHIEFDNGAFDSVWQEKLRLGENKRNTLISFRSCYRYNNQVKIAESRAMSPIGLNNYGAAVAADLDSKMEDNYRRLQAKFNRYRDDKDVKPSEAKAHIIGELNASLKRCLDLELDNLGNLEANEGTLYFRKPDYPKAFEFNVLSAGEKEAVDILLDLYLRRDDYDDTIFLIDEPELHINTAIQRKLLLEINRLVGANCQIWIATHSIGFLRALQEDLKDQCQVIRFMAGEKFGSLPITVEPVKPTLRIWREIFETALDDLVGLISPRLLIYCEGRDKPGAGGVERGLDANVFNEIFGAEQTDCQFVSSGGNTEPDQRSAIALALLSKVFPSLEIWVVKDRDMKSGKSVSEADRQQALNEGPTTLRILKRWEIENYLFDKEVLTAFCQKHGCTFDEVAYDKLVDNIVDDDVKGIANPLKACCGVDANYSTEKFKLELAAAMTPKMMVYMELRDCIFFRK
jgi:hypothetical protein